jgi:hypothetical protein
VADKNLIKILSQGVKAWNEWRDKVDDPVPDLKRAVLNGDNIPYGNLSGANLKGVDLSRAVVAGINLQGANLRAADLRSARVLRANLSDTNLRHAIFAGSELTKISFGGADFTQATFGVTQLDNVDLRGAKNLESVQHVAPSSIDIHTIYVSGGDINEKFLRGCGVPEDFITYMRSLTGKAIEFYTCFISFTEADDTFSERLYNDMQGAGVRCWRWKEDAKWGRALMHSIDEAVRVYDKLIVICSEQSLNSPAVIREIERALQKEDAAAREGKEAEVLFPIRLDDYIFTDWQHHRKADVVAKNVGDFRRWTEPKEYKKALQRLIRDLQAEARREG